MVNRQPRGIPTGGQFAHSTHDESTTPLAGDRRELLEQRLDALRRPGSSQREFAELAMASAAEIVRGAAPDARRVRLIGNHYAMRPNAIFDADGERVRIPAEEYERLEHRIGEARTGECLRAGLIARAEDPEQRGRSFFYELDLDAAQSAGERHIDHAGTRQLAAAA